MKNSIIYVVISYVVLVLSGCQRKNEYVSIKLNEKKGDLLNHIAYKIPNSSDIDSVSISFYENGHIDKIQYFKKQSLNGASVSFYKNGQLFELTRYAKGKQNGRFYSFYKSGVKASELIYEEGINVGYGLEYFDSTAIQRVLALYNNKGEAYYVLINDSMGNVISEQGNRK